jgi:hypothetical protein
LHDLTLSERNRDGSVATLELSELLLRLAQAAGETETSQKSI